MPDYDVIIIGAGPSGSAAAIALSESRLKTLIVDKCSFPREKVCGDGLIGDSIRNLKYLGVWCDVLDAGYKMDKIKFFLLPGEFFPINAEIVTLERKVLDDILLKKALANNVSFEQLSFIGKYENKNGLNFLEFIKKDSKEKKIISCTYAVVATGCQKLNALKTLSNGKVEKPDLVAIRGYYNADFPINYCLVYFDERLKKGYAWIFPMGGGLFNIGCGAKTKVASSLNLQLLLNEFVDKISEKYGSKGYWRENPKGAMLSNGMRNYRRLKLKNIFCVGESIGSTYPYTGEGIGKALETGIKAAHTILNFYKKKDDVGKVYRRKLKEELFACYRPYFWAEKLCTSPLKDYFYRKICNSQKLQNIITGILTEQIRFEELVSMKKLYAKLRGP